MEVRDGVSYDDVLVVPKRSAVDHRGDVDLGTHLAPGLALDSPILGAAMDTVTEAEAAIALSAVGGLGVVHRFLPVDDQAAEIERVIAAGERAGGAVGIDEDFVERADALVEAGAACVVVDVAHGHMERCLDAVAEIHEAFPDTVLVAGNVATAAGVADLAAAGADCVKVGVGPGSHCTTREVAGAGVPQLTAVDDCADAAAECGVTTIADGGITKSADAVKALLAGADAVMVGGLLAGTAEAPGDVVERDGERYKRSRGMASAEAGAERTDKEGAVDAAEGVTGLTPYRGSVADVVGELEAGIRSGLSYCGGADLAAAREKSEFVRNSAGAQARAGSHGGVRER
ncbi:guanosine monophosphate reductase [Halococcus salsus]|uniref:guanosine monophosphate reductase n=1 Tax=Halococcus salsus TaxID=2162894 RepID=UPI00135963B8|nr:guanosine monophosphate reductase [Halococcus salsus]